ncbi:hypothetical protein TW65_03064 [Stemphylium lycopersici]|uniref:DnaJ-domain-containing protein n=1 Tax=Stemphylium lycopersici TaxID=183478 RepID=A0A364NB87_STELY|nr:hypothetical protein TW65_03064 [Stemphylium lycopersici]RAR14443.1 DnaJ-domain-containing protein [Stemphylium lycopersici]
MPRSDIEEAHEAYYIYCRESGCDIIEASTCSNKYIGENFNTTRATAGTSHLERLYQDSIAQSKYEEERQRQGKGSRKTRDRDMRDPFVDLDDMWGALPKGRGHRFERDQPRRSAVGHKEPDYNPFIPSTYENCAHNREWTPPHTHSSAFRTGNHSYNTEGRAPSDADSSSSRSAKKHAEPSPKFETEFREPRRGFEFERKHYNTNDFFKMPHGEFPEYTRYYSDSPPPTLPSRRAAHGKSSKNGGPCYTTEVCNPFSFSTDYFPYTSSSSYTPFHPHYHYFPEASFSPHNPHFPHRPCTPPSFYSHFRSSRPRTPPSHFSSNSHPHPSDSDFHSHSSARSPPPGAIKPPTDLYTVLNISHTATASEIKKAHREMSLKWHPDRCNDEDKDKATEMMAEINQANDVLGDEKKRAFYDRWGVLPSDLG